METSITSTDEAPGISSENATCPGSREGNEAQDPVFSSPPQKPDQSLFASAATCQTRAKTRQTGTRLPQHWKRLLDALLILLSLPGLILLAPLVALLIRLGSRGPVLFIQERVGYLGRRFKCFKFRTMFVDSDTTGHQEHLRQLMHSNAPMMKLESTGDRRIIPFGLFLRASGLDELPQLLNVLRGEMSLVGPRPCLPYEYDHYLPWQKERFATVPGLTGLWQVSGKNKTTFVEMIHLDIRYAKSKTLYGDLKIMLMTVPALIAQMRQTRQAREASSSQGRLKPSIPMAKAPCNSAVCVL